MMQIRLLTIFLLTISMISSTVAENENTLRGESLNDISKRAYTGDPEALYLLGVAYLSGTGVIQDKIAAMDNFSKAASEGDAMSQIMLGSHLRSTNKAEAYAWLTTAIKQHPQNPSMVSADLALKALEKELDPAALSKGLALAKTYRSEQVKHTIRSAHNLCRPLQDL
ncbi:MAG: hypothetical protein ABW092_20385 [Candidatus Thiodiazotropha sp.]